MTTCVNMCEQDLLGDEGMHEPCSLTAGHPFRERVNTLQAKKCDDYSQGSLAEKSRGPGHGSYASAWRWRRAAYWHRPRIGSPKAEVPLWLS